MNLRSETRLVLFEGLAVLRAADEDKFAMRFATPVPATRWYRVRSWLSRILRLAPPPRFTFEEIRFTGEEALAIDRTLGPWAAGVARQRAQSARAN